MQCFFLVILTPPKTENKKRVTPTSLRSPGKRDRRCLSGGVPFGPVEIAKLPYRPSFGSPAPPPKSKNFNLPFSTDTSPGTWSIGS